ncbi:PREDICTED: SET and MYND domain-containing protein 4-like [Eufriesea mexicana]|uniref:SET and MYND domain-containing protein 4-like n=1 Tax=Eufriesea mexicana TaxID=516756 RepID=UPI00083C17A0|nr:PREDICTED: SET and MYND domain-containing protein 4-like [Eufriesea mexicana]
MFKEDDNEISDYFRSNFIKLKNAITPQDMKKFICLNNNWERIGFVLGYPQIYDLSLHLMDDQMLKNSEKALKLKDVGNKHFGRGEFVKALETYSNAVLLAPRKDLGVVLGNRSATLYHLEQYSYALTDAEEALRVGYPQELLYKIQERRARCLLGLKRHDEAILAFRNTLQALDTANVSLEKKQKLEMDIRVMLAVIEKGNQLAQKTMKISQKQRINEPKKPSLKIEDCNPLYPSCSKSVNIKDEGGNIGRHAIATRDIEPGEILVIEKPYCAFLLAEYRLSNCHYCFVKIFIPIPTACELCSYVAYCSISCRDQDAEIHKNECTLLSTLWTSGTSVNCFLALKSIIQYPFEELYKFKSKLLNSKHKCEVSVQRPYRTNDFEDVYDLITHEDEKTPEDLFHRTYIASWLLRVLKKSCYFPEHVKTPDTAQVKPSDGELYIGGLILRYLMLIQFNAHEISELAIPRVKNMLAKGKSVFIGGGIYPTVALFNHSCNPGIIRYFVGTTMVVRAIRSIPAGEEVSENYGPIFITTPEDERKRKLRLQYWFDCNCEACVAHWPVLEKIDPTVLRFKCETGKECGNVLLVRTDTNEFMIRCPKCNKSTNILKGLKALQDTDEILKVASQYLEEGNHQEALKSYLKVLKLLDETLALPVRDYHLCQQSVRLCMLALGNISYI